MPLLEEVLERYAEKTTLLLEIKADAHDPRHESLTQKIMQALEERELIEKVYLLCFDPRVLQRAYKMNPACRPVFNLDHLDRNDKTLLEFVILIQIPLPDHFPAHQCQTSHLP